MSKISDNFDVREFVPPEIWRKYRSKSKWFIRPEVVQLAEFYRKYFDAPVTINNWKWGGSLSERGYRVPDTKTGAEFSQHKLGCAFDCSIRGMTADQVRKEILENQLCFTLAGLTTIEHKDYAKTWVHSDVRVTGMDDQILIVKPSGTVNTNGIVQGLDQYFVYIDGNTVRL
jgi:hypothetical protein